MGYRIFFLIIAFMTLVVGCDAFDNDNTPYAGFDQSEIAKAPKSGVGPYSGKFSGTMTLESGTCAGIKDTVGTATQMDVDVVQKDKIINITLTDKSVIPGELSTENKGIFVQQSGNTKKVFYLTFSEESKINGTCEAIEPNASGEYAAACANYTITLTKSAE